MDEPAERRTVDVPSWPTSFVGRETELKQVGAVLEEARVVTLTGPGGYGKTRLAREVAAGTAGHHDDGVRWVDLAPALPRSSMVAYAVARAFGLVEEPARSLVATLSERLARADVLVVLDHCDRLREPCAALVAALVGATVALQVLVTVREPLGVAVEATYPVHGLDPDAAVRLFHDRASQVGPRFGTPGDEADAVSEVCRLVDGAPLAIELAAARARTMSPAGIAAGLRDRLQSGTTQRRNTPTAPAPVGTVFRWSCDLLDQTDRAVLRRLSVFADGCTPAAAVAVCAGGEVDPDTVAVTLSRLVGHALVEQEEEDGASRYRLAETIRSAAAVELVTAGEADATRDRHLDQFVALAERAEPELVHEDGPRWLDHLERERHNLLAVADWCESTGSYEPLLRLLTALTLFFEFRSHLQAGGRWFDRALAAEKAPSTVRARALWAAGHLALHRGDVEALGRYAPEALAVAEEVGDEAALCRALNINGAAAAWLTANVDSGRAMLERSAALGRKLGDDWALAEGLRLSSFAWVLQGDDDAGARPLAEFRRVAERLGNRFLIAWYHTITGWARLQRGDFARAEQTLELALEEDRELGGVATVGIAEVLLGEVEARTARYAEAEARLWPFLQNAAASGNYLAAPWGFPILARLLVGLDRPGEARDILEPLLERLRPLGVPLHVADSLRVLGAAHLGLGDDAAAEAALTEARSLAGTIHSPWLAAHADHDLAELARRRGDMAEATTLHRAALAERARVRLRPGITESLEAIAGLAVQEDRFIDAARLFSAAAALRRAMGLGRWPADQPNYDHDVTRMRQTLGKVAGQTAWAEGATLSLDEAAAYAGVAPDEEAR